MPDIFLQNLAKTINFYLYLTFDGQEYQFYSYGFEIFF